MTKFPRYSPLVAGILSATIAVTSLGTTTRPAHALEPDRLGQLLFGAAAVAIVAKIYHDTRDDDRKPASSPAPVQQAGAPGYGRSFQSGGRPEARSHHAGGPRPLRCARQLQTRTGWVRFYSQACLDRVGAEASVPQTCLRQRNVEGRWLTYFSRRCLVKFGRIEQA